MSSIAYTTLEDPPDHVETLDYGDKELFHAFLMDVTENMTGCVGEKQILIGNVSFGFVIACSESLGLQDEIDDGAEPRAIFLSHLGLQLGVRNDFRVWWTLAKLDIPNTKLDPITGEDPELLADNFDHLLDDCFPEEPF